MADNDWAHRIVHNEYVMDEVLGQADYHGNYPCCAVDRDLKQK